MADVLNRTTKELRRSVNTPDYDPAEWIIDPDLSAVAGFAPRYWKITGDVVSLVDQAERDAVDAALAQQALDDAGAAEKARLDDERILRAFALIVMDEINILRGIAGLPDRTEAQLVGAIKARVDTL
jgi:hypothetical protein